MTGSPGSMQAAWSRGLLTGFTFLSSILGELKQGLSPGRINGHCCYFATKLGFRMSCRVPGFGYRVSDLSLGAVLRSGPQRLTPKSETLNHGDESRLPDKLLIEVWK